MDAENNKQNSDMLMEDRLKQLENVSYEDPKKVFSLYLNTDPRDPEQKGEKWKIQLKNALNDLEKETKDSASHEEKNQSKDIRKKVETETYEKQDKLQRSVILFATADEDLWFSHTLNVPVTTESHWGNAPELGQLRELVTSYPHTGVLVLQQDQAMIIDAELGMVLDTMYYKLDLNSDQWRQHQGPQGDDWTQGGAKKDEYQDRVEAHQQRWFKNLAETMEKKRKKRGWKQMYLVGEQDEIEPLQDYFHYDIDKTVPRNLLGRNPENILADIYED